MKSNEVDHSRAAVICSHIAAGQLPILLAVRDEPISDEDSGWQFLCNLHEDEDDDRAQVWSINEVVEYEPSLSQFVEYPVGTKLYRQNAESDWVLVQT